MVNEVLPEVRTGVVSVEQYTQDAMIVSVGFQAPTFNHRSIDRAVTET